MSRAAGGISLFALIVALGYGQEAYAQTDWPPSPTVPTATCGLRNSRPTRHARRMAIHRYPIPGPSCGRYIEQAEHLYESGGRCRLLDLFSP